MLLCSMSNRRSRVCFWIKWTSRQTSFFLGARCYIFFTFTEWKNRKCSKWISIYVYVCTQFYKRYDIPFTKVHCKPNNSTRRVVDNKVYRYIEMYMFLKNFILFLIIYHYICTSKPVPSSTALLYRPQKKLLCIIHWLSHQSRSLSL